MQQIHLHLFFFLLFTPRGGDYESVFLGFQKLFMQSRATTKKKIHGNSLEKANEGWWSMVADEVYHLPITLLKRRLNIHTHNKTEYVVTLAEVDHI